MNEKQHVFLPNTLDPARFLLEPSICPVPFFTFEVERDGRTWDAVGLVFDNAWLIGKHGLDYTVVAVTKEGRAHGYINVGHYTSDFKEPKYIKGFSTMPHFEEPFYYVPLKYQAISKNMLQLYAALFESNE